MKQFCETSFKNGKLLACSADGLVPMRFAIFPIHLSKLLRLPTKKWCQVIRSAAPVTQNHLSKPEDLRLQNATPLRKSPPGPPNSSDEDVSCTAPATENASLQILSNVPRLPSFLEMLQNLHVLLTFDKVHNPLRLPRESTSEPPKVVRTPLAGLLFDPRNSEPQNIGIGVSRLFYPVTCLNLLSTCSLFFDSSQDCCCICP